MVARPLCGQEGDNAIANLTRLGLLILFVVHNSLRAQSGQVERRVITDIERYEFIRQCTYKIYAFSQGKHFEITFPSPGYSESEFDKAIDSAILDLDDMLKKDAMDKLSFEERKILGL